MTERCRVTHPDQGSCIAEHGNQPGSASDPHRYEVQRHRCFECGEGFAKMADIRVWVEDEGSNDVFWAPIHLHCRMAREAMFNSIRVMLPVLSGSDKGKDGNCEPSSPGVSR